MEDALGHSGGFLRIALVNIDGHDKEESYQTELPLSAKDQMEKQRTTYYNTKHHYHGNFPAMAVHLASDHGALLSPESKGPD